MRYEPNIIYKGKEINSKDDFPISIDYFRKIEKIKNYIYPMRFLSKINSQVCDLVTTEFEFLEKFGKINTQLGIKGDTFIEQFLKAEVEIKYLDFYIKPPSTPKNWRDSYTTPKFVYFEYRDIIEKLVSYTLDMWYALGNYVSHYNITPLRNSIYLGNIKNYYLEFLIFKIFYFRDIPKKFETPIEMLCNYFIILESFSFRYYDFHNYFFKSFVPLFGIGGLQEITNIFLDTIKELVGFLGGDINHEHLKYPKTYHPHIVNSPSHLKVLKLYLLELL